MTYGHPEACLIESPSWTACATPGEVEDARVRRCRAGVTTPQLSIAQRQHAFTGTLADCGGVQGCYAGCWGR